MIETVVAIGEFVGRNEQISPVSIKFHIRYVSPRMLLKYDGNSEMMSLPQGRMGVASIKANKLGEYPLEVMFGD